MYYFAYGSNLWPARLSARVGACHTVGVATVRGWTLTFNKEGGDGSAKCDAQHTVNDDDQLYGVIYEIESHQRDDLDVFEGLGHGYDIHDIDVQCLPASSTNIRSDVDTDNQKGVQKDGHEAVVTPTSRSIQAQLYVAIADHAFRRRQSSAQPILPYTWYYQYVLQGARYHSFPQSALQRISQQSHKPDPDSRRARRNAHLLSLTMIQGAALKGTDQVT